MSELILYYTPTCPYCQKVLKYMSDNGVNLELRDISSEESHAKELVDIGGKRQVPCLIIDGKAMYESDDIIAWLKQNHSS